jgi:hypothetical protein
MWQHTGVCEYSVYCAGCKAEGPLAPSVEMAIQLWNRRPIEKTLRIEVERLKLDVDGWQKLQGIWEKTAKTEKVEIERLQAVADRFASFGERIVAWLVKGNLEPSWYDDFMDAVEEYEAAKASPK